MLVLRLGSFEVQACPKVNIVVFQRFYTGTFKKNRTRLQFDWSHILSKTHTSHKALAESNFPLKCSKKGIIILSFTIFYLHCIHLGHMKLANIPRAFGFISLNLQIIEKNTTPPKKHAIFLDPKPLHPPKKLAVHNRQCNPMILEARLSIEMKENLRKPGGETRLCSQTQGAWERLCKKIHYICKLQQDLMHLNSFILLPASQSHANTQIHPRSASQSLLVRNLCLPGTFSLTWLRSLKSLIQAGKILDGMNKKCTHQLNQTDIMTSNNLQIIS